MNMSSNTQIEECAAEWLARRDRDDWSEAQEVNLTTWLRASTAHRVAYLRLEAAWQQSARLKALGAGVAPGHIPPPGTWADHSFSDPSVPESPPQAGKRKKMLRRVAHAIAASLILCAFGTGAWYRYASHGTSYATIVGGLAAVPLKDGSRITLNSDSEVLVAVSVKERHVELSHGEAFFEVAKDPKRPFVVSAGHERITAVGTQFSVRRDGDEVDVVVIEGHVRVERDGQPSGSPPTLLAPGGIAQSDRSGVLVQEKPVAEAQEILSWRSGYLVFHDTPLSNAVAQFNRYNTRKIVIDDSKVSSLRIGGNFKSTNAEAFVRLLESGLPIRAERRDDQIILHSN
jgi:transmembrane sensor